MNSGEDLMGIGTHCAFPECNQLDFLPFKCDCCSKVFCLEHRTYASHLCDHAGNRDTQVFICPLCARAVKMQAGDDANSAFERHCQTECDPSNYERVHKKKRCPVAGCKEKLTSINAYTCRDCSSTVCLRHRLAMDHKCPGKAASAAAAAQSRFAIPQALKGFFSGSGSGGSVQQAGAAKPASTAARPAQPARGKVAAATAAPKGDGSGSAAAQLQQYRAQQQQQQQQQRAGSAGSAAAAAAGSDVVDLTGGSRAGRQQPGAGAGPELCQQCGARFATVQQLIEHAERAHIDGWNSGGSPIRPPAAGAQQQQLPRGGGHGELERCPHCGQQFADAVALVAHVEREHASSQRDGCVLC